MESRTSVQASVLSTPLLDALPEEPVLQSNALAAVTERYVVIRTERPPTSSMIALPLITGARRVKTTFPGLLVIAVALFLVAAAAACSKQGDGAAIPMALLGAVFVLFYLGSRKAAVVLSLERDQVETVQGSLRDARALLKALEEAQRRAANFSAERDHTHFQS